MRVSVLFSRSLLLAVVSLLLVASAGATSIVIDGSNDFTPADTYATSTPGFTGYATHDGVNLYLGFDGPGLFSAPTTTWMLAYLGTGAPGTTSGITLNTQQPGLPFSASHVIRWRLDGFFQDVQAWNGVTWSTAAIGSAIAQSTNYFEMAVNLGALGSPNTLQYAAYLLNDQTFNEWSYAAVPGSAFVDSYDPQIASHLTFNIVPEPSTSLLAGAGLVVVAARRRRAGQRS